MRRILVLMASLAAALLIAVPALAESGDSADLGVVVSTDKTTYKVGDLVTYTLTVTNYGEADADDVTVTDVLPAGLELVSVTPEEPAPWTLATAETDAAVDSQWSTANAGSGGTAVSVLLGTVSSGLYSPEMSTATVTIVARATAAGDATNQASVSSLKNPDPNVAANNYAAAKVTVST